jgi:hypothetical protein
VATLRLLLGAAPDQGTARRAGPGGKLPDAGAGTQRGRGHSRLPVGARLLGNPHPPSGSTAPRSTSPAPGAARPPRTARSRCPAARGVAGWYALGPRPGDPGSAVILGHVDSKRGPAVFYRLRQLLRGDEIDVSRAEPGSSTPRLGLQDGGAGAPPWRHPDRPAGLTRPRIRSLGSTGTCCSWPSQGRLTAATVLGRSCWSRSVRAV